MKTKLVIFGITGDLSKRKLLPALQRIIDSGGFDDLSIIGVSRRQVNVRELLEQSMGATKLAERITIVSMDLAEAKDYQRLKETLALTPDEQLLMYLSVPPRAATRIVDFAGEAGLNTPNVKILFEKPFGVDLASAEEAIARTARYFSEDQIYRIDHYLAKEMAQNIVAFRGGNALFSQIWSREAIASIEIIASEKIDIEGRAQFYEQTGALRDVVQGHLMQLLALTLMEIPADFDWNNLPDLRLEALKQLRLVAPERVIRGQYRGYQEEVENPGSLTETFVSLELESMAKRWRGVPIRLTTGKALSEKTTEVRISLRKVHEAQSNLIVFKIQPDEGIRIGLFVKKPGYAREFERQNLSFNFPRGTQLPDADEQVLVDAVQSRKSLFTCSDEVLTSWKILRPLQEYWDMNAAPPLCYDKGMPSIDIK